MLALDGRFFWQCMVESMLHIGAVPDDKFSDKFSVSETR
jgi:hypothetical protein